ncbi:hypothetical protein BJV77DRAFT_986954 [Russula vinacea]|nr:hypothetical protein BJV77DRAFT_986954 [Russula vinacea]
MMAPAHAPLARASLDSSEHSLINVFLNALFAQHATELAVLERIYYINNNQHRPALFWQRVVEARRYSRRLRSLDVPSLVDGLRRSFYGDVVDASSKLQKGAWTHYPPAPSLKSFLARVRTCTALLDKTCVRMRGIYHMLSLAMQSGAFLHLVVTLTALVARIAHLSSAVRGVLSTLHNECAHLFARLHPTVASHNFARSLPPPPPRLEGRTQMRAVPDSDLDASVDLGEAIAHLHPHAARLLLPMHDATPAPVIGTRQPAAGAGTAAEADHAPVPSALVPSSRLAAVSVKNQNRIRPTPSSSRAATADAAEERKGKGSTSEEKAAARRD